jgi:hypothetical protein
MRPVSFRDLETSSFASNRSRLHAAGSGGVSAVLQSRTSHVAEDIEAFDLLRRMAFDDHQNMTSGHLLRIPATFHRPIGHWGRSETGAQRGETIATDQGDTYEQLQALDEGNVSKGINVRVQQRVLKVRRVGPKDDAACAVCQEDYTSGESASFLPCGHCFHQACISPWLLKDRTCPTCRREVYHSAVP